MLDFSRFKISFIIALCLLFIWLAFPNFLSEEQRASAPQGMIGQPVNLGLDLRGGSQLLLEVDFDSYLKEQYVNLRSGVRAALRDAKAGYSKVRVQGDSVIFTLLREKTPEDFSMYALLRNIEEGLEFTEDGDIIRVTFNDQTIRKKKGEVLSQSIEIIGRRINETGLREPTIQRQGESRVLVQVPGLENPEMLKDILGKTAKMSFHLVNEKVNPLAIGGASIPPGTELIPAAERESESAYGMPSHYAIFSKVELSGELLTNASMTFGEAGDPVVSFAFNTLGARKFAKITTVNVGKRFAVVLDGKVITAPTMRVPLLDGRGIIEGGFTAETAANLALLLRAGALPAPMEIVEERSVGPSLGADSIAAGKAAAAISIALVMVFMVLSYGLFGMFSNIALAINMLILLGCLSFFQATLTLPGIAGIVLTLGMAVDANVLIFERIREEVARGRNAMAALDEGFRAAFGTIVDSNITTLIAATVLYIFGTGTIKGFAVTLSIGILASMFSAILLTRLMVAVWAKKKRPTIIPI